MRKEGALQGRGTLSNIPWVKQEALGEAQPSQGVNLRDGRPQNSLRHSLVVHMVKSIFEQNSPPWQHQPTHLDAVDFFFFATGGAAGELTAPPPSGESPCADMDLLSASRRLDMLGERTTPFSLLQRSRLRLVCSCTERIRAKTARPRPFVRRAIISGRTPAPAAAADWPAQSALNSQEGWDKE